MKAQRTGTSVLETKQVSPLLDEPPLGHLQALVLKKLDELGKDAFGYKALEELSSEAGTWIDASQIYASIRKLMAEEKQFIEFVGSRKSPDGGPPLKLYRVTAAGRAALKITAAHYRAVADRLEQ